MTDLLAAIDRAAQRRAPPPVPAGARRGCDCHAAAITPEEKAQAAAARACRWRQGCPFHSDGISGATCMRCPLPAVALVADARAPMVLLSQSPGYRERHSTFFVEPWTKAGWRVEVAVQQRDAPAFGIPEAVARLGAVPDVIVQWEEHGCARATAPWREVIAWCYAHGVLPAALDFGYVSHYEQFMLDAYRPDGTSSIEDDWAAIPPGPITWDQTAPAIRERHRRAMRGYTEARAKPRLIEVPYVALFLQQYPSLCRLTPCGHHNEIVAQAAEALRAKGLRLAVKTAPSTPADRALTQWPRDVTVYRHEEAPGDTNQRLAVHAEYCLVVSSSITNEFVQASLPVAALGRSWFNDKGIFTEPSRWEDLPAAAPEIREPERERYLRWWLDRQFASADAGAALHRLAGRCRSRPAAGAVVTCLYAPDEATERLARASLKASAEALPDWQRLVPVDAARPHMVIDLIGQGAQVLALPDGEPPRMGRLLAAAVARAHGGFLFTVEQDVMLPSASAAAAVELLRALPARVAGLYLQSTDETGQPNYPWAHDWPRATPWGEDPHYRVPEWPTLSATLWRLSALRLVDWARVPALEFVDGEIGNQLRRLGYTCLMTDLAQAVHFSHSGRKCLHGTARTLAIGCGKNLWARRGIRFSWFHPKSADVVCKDAGVLPFDADSFREIYVCGELHGLTPMERNRFLGHAWRVLRHDGRLDLCEPATAGIALDDARWRVDRAGPNRLIAFARKP